jgi:hypothetical protein
MIGAGDDPGRVAMGRHALPRPVESHSSRPRDSVPGALSKPGLSNAQSRMTGRPLTFEPRAKGQKGGFQPFGAAAESLPANSPPEVVGKAALQAPRTRKVAG